MKRKKKVHKERSNKRLHDFAYVNNSKKSIDLSDDLLTANQFELPAGKNVECLRDATTVDRIILVDPNDLNCAFDSSSIESASVEQIVDCSSPKENNNIESNENEKNKENEEKGKKVEQLFWCDFCKTIIPRYARHLAMKDNKETEVMAFLKLPTTSKKRKLAIAKIRKDHRIIFNKSQGAKKYGLQVARRPNKNESLSPSHWTQCSSCKR